MWWCEGMEESAAPLHPSSPPSPTPVPRPQSGPSMAASPPPLLALPSPTLSSASWLTCTRPRSVPSASRLPISQAPPVNAPRVSSCRGAGWAGVRGRGAGVSQSQGGCGSRRPAASTLQAPTTQTRTYGTTARARASKESCMHPPLWPPAWCGSRRCPRPPSRRRHCRPRPAGGSTAPARRPPRPAASRPPARSRTTARASRAAAPPPAVLGVRGRACGR